MPRTIKTKDGIILNNVPDDVSDDEIKQRIGVIRGERDTAAPEPSTTDKATSYGASVLSGVTALPRGAFQLGANIGDKLSDRLYEDQMGGSIELTDYAKERAAEAGMALPEKQPLSTFGDSVNAEIKGKESIKRELMNKAGREGFDFAELGGMVTSPLSFVKTGVVNAPKIIAGSPVAKSLMQKVYEGGKVGWLYSAGIPVINSDNYGLAKAEQVGTGMVAGGVMPVAGELLKSGGRVVDQFTRPMAFRNKMDKVVDFGKGKVRGIQRDLQELTSEMLGESKGKVVNALLGASKSGANKNPTAGQAVAEYNLKNPDVRIGNPMLKLEDEIAFNPATSDKLNTVYRGQRHGRAKIIDALSGTDEAYQAAKNARAKATKPYYDAVDASTTRIDSKPVISLVDDILAKNPNKDSVTIPLKQIRRKLGDGEYEPSALKSLSDDIGEKINAKNPQTGKNEYNVQALTEIKRILDKQIKRDVPEFGIAQKVHAKKSAPINQMDIARAVREKMGTEINDEAAKPFIKAMNDEVALIKKATGFKRGKGLEDIYKGNPEALKQLKAVVDDLEINLEAGKMSKEIGSVFGGVKKGIEPRIPGMLEREVVLANALLKKISTDKTGEYAKELARLVQNPEKFAELLNAPTSSPLVVNTLELFNQLSKGVPMASSKEIGGY